MLGIPAPTRLDLRFRLLGIPVRVSPFFWLVAVVIAWDEASPAITLIGVGCVFLSILVHELGHGLTARVFRDRPTIVLHGMGGLCTVDGEGPRVRAAGSWCWRWGRAPGWAGGRGLRPAVRRWPSPASRSAPAAGAA